jgi:hypothetical protein
MGKIVGHELPPRVLEALQGGVEVVLATVDAGGWPDTAPFSWVLALDVKTIRLGINSDTTTLGNVRDNGRAMLHLSGKGMVVSIKGQARVIKETMESTPFPTTLVEMTVLEVKDDSVVGRMFTSDSAVRWSGSMHESTNPVYIELRSKLPD